MTYSSLENTKYYSSLNRKKIKILMRPCYDIGLQNRIFELQDLRAEHWQYPLYQLRSIAQSQGVEIDTWDMYPLSEAELILVQDLPAKKEEIIKAKKQAPNTPFVLLLYESPLDRTHFYEPTNHDLFDAVITFNHHLADEKKIFSLSTTHRYTKLFTIFHFF
ncbi:MAG: hypothetical protein HC930_14565 [Hydrococcus sp. SU_1_0]|nr:hypothetical protein [Hydrococcus sp. SU_1_0]